MSTPTTNTTEKRHTLTSSGCRGNAMSTTEHEGVTVKTWNEWAEESTGAKYVEATTLDPHATPCPDWCTDSPHTFECDPLDRMHCSDSVSLPLQHHGGAKRQESVLVFPVAEVRLGRAYTTTEPLIELSRRVPQPNGAMTINEGATYHFSPAEAAELARILLAAVDVALGLGDPSQTS